MSVSQCCGRALVSCWERSSSGREAGPRSRVRACAAKDDPVTSFVKLLFGAAAVDDPAPAGLKRMTIEEWPDQWPATTDTWAAPLGEGEDGEAALLRPLLKQTMLERLPLALAYDASVHGWSAEAFHACLDGQGAALLVAESEAGSFVGGYNPKGWLGYGDWRDAISAFLFARNQGGGAEFVKVPKVGGSGMAIIDEQGGGPCWGPDGLKIDLEKRVARSRLGSYYAKLPNGDRTLFSDKEGQTARLTAVRVYVGLGETEKAASYKPSALQWQPGELESIRERD